MLRGRKSTWLRMGPEAHADALDSNSLASGDVDVLNTKAQLILPCLENVTIHAMIAEEPIALVPDFPTLAMLAPDLTFRLGTARSTARTRPPMSARRSSWCHLR